MQQVLASSNTAVNTPPPPPGPTVNNFQVDDMTTATSFNRPGMPYTGPVAGVQNQYVQLNADNLDIKALTPNAFIHSDGGNDTLTAFSGRNILDAGDGTNVIVGSTGQGSVDTFLAGIGSAQPGTTVVDLIRNFHIGDDVIARGLSDATFNFSFSDATGALGPQLQVQATSTSGGPNVTVALVGFSTGDLASGRLIVSFSTDQSSDKPFMLIHANS